MNHPGTPPAPGPVRRLTFEYDGDSVQLVSEQHVRMIVPPSQPVEHAPSPNALAVVMRDAKEQPVYQFAHTSPLRHDAEVFGDDPYGKPQRVAVERPKGTFVLLVPDVPGAQTLELVAPPRPAGPATLQPGARQLRPEAPQTLVRMKLRPYEEK